MDKFNIISNIILAISWFVNVILAICIICTDGQVDAWCYLIPSALLVLNYTERAINNK